MDVVWPNRFETGLSASVNGAIDGSDFTDGAYEPRPQWKLSAIVHDILVDVLKICDRIISISIRNGHIYCSINAQLNVAH